MTANAGYFVPPKMIIFLTLKVTKLPYFDTILLEDLGRPDVHHLQQFRNVRTSKIFFI